MRMLGEDLGPYMRVKRLHCYSTEYCIEFVTQHVCTYYRCMYNHFGTLAQIG